MKFDKIVIASILVAAFMVIPAGFVFVDTDSSSASENPPVAGDVFNLSALAEVSDLASYEPVEPTDTSVVGTGTWDKEFLKYNYKFADKAVRTVSGYVALCPLQSFSISSEGVGGIIFPKDTGIKIVSDSVVTPDSTLYEYTFEEETAFYFSGTYTFTVSVTEAEDEITGFNAKLEVAKDSILQDAATAESSQFVIKFDETSYMEVSADMTTMGGHYKDSVKATLTSGPMAATVTGSSDFKLESSIEDQGMTIEADISGSSEYTLDGNLAVDDEKVNIKMNFNVDVDKLNVVAKTDDKGDVNTTIDGSISASYEIEKTSVTLKGVEANLDVDVDNSDFSIFAEVGLGTYEFEPDNGNPMLISDVSVSAGLEGKITDFGDAFAPTSALAVLDASSLAASPAIVNEYFTYIENEKAKKEAAGESFDIEEAAGQFFLSKITIPGAVAEKVTFDASIGEVNMIVGNKGGVYLEDFDLSVEVSKSVGVDASASIGSFVYYTDSEDAIKVGLDSVKASVTTSEEKDVMFDINARGTGGFKKYVSGVLTEDTYVNGLNVDLAFGKEVKIVDISAKELGVGQYGVTVVATKVTYDAEKKVLNLGDAEVEGYYFGEALISEVSGTFYNCTMDLGNKKTTTTIESSDVTLIDIYGNQLTMQRTYDAETKTVTNQFDVDGVFWVDEIYRDEVLKSLLFFPYDGALETENYIINGGAMTYSADAIPSSDTTKSVVYKDGKITVGNIVPTVKGNFVGDMYITRTLPRGDYDVPGQTLVVNDKVYRIETAGCAIGFSVNDAGEIYFKVVALPGYELAEDMAKNGFTINSIDNGVATITPDPATDVLNCTAKTPVFNVYIDGNKVLENQTLSVPMSAKVGDNTVFLVDKNGAKIGNVADKEWSYTRFIGTGDLELTSVNATVLPTVDVKKNTVDDYGVTFTVPAGFTSDTKFIMKSKVQFTLSGTTKDDKITLIAQETKFDGKDAFIIKASYDNGANANAVIYLPVSGDGFRVMHVDQYGRVSERVSQLIYVDGEAFQKVTTNDFSIFYTEKDTPSYDTSSGGKNNTLLYVAIGVGIVVIAGAAFFIGRKYL